LRKTSFDSLATRYDRNPASFLAAVAAAVGHRL
jgi:hypothetical protein